MTENERRTALKKNEIIRIYGTEFKDNTVRLLREAELASLIPAKDARIGIKPNLVSASEASFGATTHPEIVAGIIEYLHEEGFNNITIAEGSWVGDKTSRAFGPSDRYTEGYVAQKRLRRDGPPALRLC